MRYVIELSRGLYYGNTLTGGESTQFIDAAMLFRGHAVPNAIMKQIIKDDENSEFPRLIEVELTVTVLGVANV